MIKLIEIVAWSDVVQYSGLRAEILSVYGEVEQSVYNLDNYDFKLAMIWLLSHGWKLVSIQRNVPPGEVRISAWFQKEEKTMSSEIHPKLRNAEEKRALVAEVQAQEICANPCEDMARQAVRALVGVAQAHNYLNLASKMEEACIQIIVDWYVEGLG
jgi:hypothetical protein